MTITSTNNDAESPNIETYGTPGERQPEERDADRDSGEEHRGTRVAIAPEMAGPIASPVGAGSGGTV